MAYIGQSPAVGEFKKLDDISGSFDDVTTSFALTSDGVGIAPGTAPSFLISLDGVIQEPVTSYTISGSNVVFASAPNTSSTFFGIQLGSVGQVGTPSDLTVTTNKITANAVTTAKIADASVTTDKIADGNVTLAKIADGAVTGDKLDIDAVTNTKILDSAVSESKLASSSVTTSKIAPNIQLQGTVTYLGASIEKANVIASNITANVNVDGQLESIVYYTENSTSNVDVTVNFNNLAYVSTGNVINHVVMLTNNVDFQAYVGNVQINGASGNVVRWLGGLPTEGSSNLNVYSFSVVKTADSSYTVLASKNNFD